MITRDTPEAAFMEMGQYLLDRRQLVDIAVYGGSAMLLEYSTTFTTNDADVVIGSGHGAAVAAARAVAKKRGWPAGWFNEQVSVFVVGDQRDLRYFRSYPSEAAVGMRVYVAPPETLLAMKLAALRSGTRDAEDAAFLARQIGLTTVDGLLGLFRKYQRVEPSPRQIVAIGEVARKAGGPDAP